MIEKEKGDSQKENALGKVLSSSIWKCLLCAHGEAEVQYCDVQD